MDNNNSFLPYKELKSKVDLPVELYEFQQAAVNALGPLPRLGLYFDVGCGKTFTAIVISLYKMLYTGVEKAVVIMPPVLLQNWKRNIEKFTPMCWFTLELQRSARSSSLTRSSS